MSEIGVDQWVEQSDQRREKHRGLTARVRRIFDRLEPGWRLAIFTVVVAALPFFLRQGEVRVGVSVLILALLALGLNIVVGWAGLLDLGHAAFVGFGAYFYAAVASDQLPAHWPTIVAVPIIVVAAGALGALISLASRRLVGDYLAILTLFFGLIFLEIVRNFSRLPFVSDGFDLTGGPNGIPGVDAWNLLGYDINTFNRYYYLLLIVLVLMIVGLHNLDKSRTGRAWRATREDPLAAEHMTTPVNKVRLLAFTAGAAIAGFTGTIFTAVQVGVFPTNFALVFLISIYAAVILGGSGSIPGVILGAIVIGYLPEMLRDPTKAGWLFYLVIAAGMMVLMRPWQRLQIAAGGLIVFGFAVRWIAEATWSEATTGETCPGICFDDSRWLGTGSGRSRADHHQLRLRGGNLWRPPRRDEPGLVEGCRAGSDPLFADTRMGKPPRVRAEPHTPVPLRSTTGRDDGGPATRPSGQETGRDHMKPILELRGLNKSFGGLQVIFDLDLEVEEREILSVIGPNGAGKTTLFNLITAIYPPDSGDILLGGQSILGLNTDAIAALGIARTFQTLRIFLNMTVKENVMTAAYADTKTRIWQSMLRTPAARREEAQIAKLAESKLAFFGERLMGYRWDQPAYSLSYANRRRLEIARAMASNPRLLLLDEPAAGMNPSETHEMTELIGRLRDEAGHSILVIEHDMHVVEGISDRVIALDHGERIAEGSFDEVATSPDVIEAYLGYGAATRK